MLLSDVFLSALSLYYFVVGGCCTLASTQLDDDFYTGEIDVLAQFKSRLTGSTNHTDFVNYLEKQLVDLGLKVHSDNFVFQYQVPPPGAPGIPGLVVNNKSIPAAAFVPYAGYTNASGVSGRLVQIALPANATVSPNWTAAAGNIAWVDLYNTPVDASAVYPTWPGTDEFGQIAGIPSTNAGMRSLAAAAAAGVKGVIYNWRNISTLNAFGQYGPFKSNYQGVPAIYVTNQAMQSVQAANGSMCTITSGGQFVNGQQTRTIYTVIEGTELKNESVILSTHSDGTNAVEENGHIALLAKARELAASPPRRTTILLFVTGHLHTSGFTGLGRVTERWLQDHPDLWAGNTTSSLKAVFGSCVEHLGALHWREDVPNNVYYPTGAVEDELLFAATPELASLLEDVWQGAAPDVRRIVDPNLSLIEQSGEGLPYLWNNIPEISLCTAPDWLLKIWPSDFDERQLMDLQAVKRQVESFLRVWQAVDGMTATGLGNLNYSRSPL